MDIKDEMGSTPNNETNKSSNEQLSLKVNILKNNELFKNISYDQIESLAKSAEVVKAPIGLPLATRENTNKNILIIIKGEARLLGKINNTSLTLAKLTPGSAVGLSSFIQNRGCEEVIASTEVLALSILDEDLLNVYNKEENFRQFFEENILINELVSLTETLLISNTKADEILKTTFNQLVKSSKIALIDKGKLKEYEDNYIYICASENFIDLNKGDLITPDIKLKIEQPYPPRIVSIPKSIYNQIVNSDINKYTPKVNSSSESTNFKELNFSPDKSNLEIPNSSQVKKSKIIRAQGEIQEFLATIKMLANELDIAFRGDASEKFLRDELRKNNKFSIKTYSAVLSMHDLIVGVANIPPQLSSRITKNSLINFNNNFLLVKNSNEKSLELACPREGLIKVPISEIIKKEPKGVENLIVQKTNTTPQKKFNIEWFLPSLKKHKNTLILVLFASFIVQLFGLANPLLIQVIIDKVISQRSLDTLQVLGTALVFVTLLGGVLGGLRTFLFAETTNRIDTALGAEIIDHLLRLPLGYFDKRPVGELGSRIAELEKIREFLTGQALTTILDAAFSIIYILVMFLYSSLLTFIALGVIPIQIVLTLIGAPLIRRQIREVANQNAKTQSHLVEVLTGIQTVKAQNVETITRWKWQELYSAYISRTFEKTISLTTLSQISQVLQQLSQLLVLWIGASLVLKGNLTLGQLIAFRIISGYVTQPILRLSNIWQSIQELRVSFERLADIVDTPKESTETDKQNIQLPSVKGKVEFEDVSFSFRKGLPNVLKNINLSIEQGQFVGIVGQSGSGKSTLMKVLPRLYELEEGKIKIDGLDISKTELYSLRRQVGIVPQDPLLFSGSVSENISVANPESSSEEIIQAAKTADAHDFIMSLPTGYSTNVGERGANLSGGQKQRIAIARTLLAKPNLLIMDEATSALDYQTERRVCENLKDFCKGSTVFFITHRLNTIKNADLIIMMHDGFIFEKGSHNELIEAKGRYYALYRQQEAE